MEKFTMNPRRLIIAGGGAFLLILLIWFATSYGVLTVISSGGGAKQIFVRGGDFKQFELDNGSKTLFVKRGTYTIEVSQGDKLSLYAKSMDFLSKNEVRVDLFDQKEASLTGISDLPCSRKDSGTVFYYACRQTNSTAIRDEAGRYVDDGSSIYVPESEYSAALLPYKVGFIQAEAVNTDVTMTERTPSQSGRRGFMGRSVLPGFRGMVSDSTFSASPNGGRFGIYDRASKQATIFKNLADRDPTVINLAGEDVNEDILSSRLVVSKDYTYLLNLRASLDSSGEDVATAAESPRQKILIYDSSGKIVDDVSLPNEVFVKAVAPGPGNKALVLAAENSQDQAYLLDGRDGLKPLSIPVEAPQEACWKDTDSFYMTADAGSEIYTYSLSKQAAYLAYGNLTEEARVSGLTCHQGGLSFTLDSDKDAEVENYVHYSLTNDRFSGVRPETVLPLYFDIGRGTYKAAVDKAGVRIETVYVEPGGAPNREQIRAAATESLKAKGIDVSKVNLLY